MTRWKGRIYATITLALECWQFVEVQDIDVERIDEVEEER